MLKRSLLILTLVAGTLLTLTPTKDAEAYWGYKEWRYRGNRSTYRFQPRFALSISGGLHFVDTYINTQDAYNDFSPAFAFGMFELGGHLWVHPNLSIDLAVAGHLTFSDIVGADWGYVSIKPGIRARFGYFYLRGALDIAFSEEPNRANSYRRPILFGFLIGVGVRVPVSRMVRVFGELSYQFMFSDFFYMPFYGKVGLEFVF
ncbi:MAG: hypothetical protein EP343_33430 [Deltaproteobacteria bacterium]|nr:MAG: hypothetical protein EP343_33430 [Deltaproteobacteria bacterium]